MANEEKQKEIDRLGQVGGPLLGSLARLAIGLAKGPIRAGERSARGLEVDMRGRAAYRHMERGGFILRLMSGNLISKANRVEQGNRWAARHGRPSIDFNDAR